MLFSFGGHYLGIPSTLEGAVRFFGVSIPYQRLLILVVAVVMLVFCWFVLYRTRLGLAIRATANDLEDRKSTRLNSSHGYISYAVFCLKKKKKHSNHLSALSILD